MFREFLSIGSFQLSPFGPMLVAAFLAAYLQLRWGMRHLGIGDEEDPSVLLLTGGIAGIVGAKVYYAVLYGDWRTLFDRSGLVWYGGFFLALAALLVVMRWRRLPTWPTIDALTPALALGYGIGRIGCFLVGDDYGMPTRLPWGVAFPYGLPEPTTAAAMRRYGAELPADIAPGELVRVHPTQLYETLAGVTIWAVGVVALRRGARPGTTALLVIGLLALERFLVELIRAKDDRFFGALTLAQVLSLAVIAAVLALAALRRRRRAAAGV